MKKIILLIIFILTAFIFLINKTSIFAETCNTPCTTDEPACGKCRKIKCDPVTNEALCDSHCMDPGPNGGKLVDCNKMPPGGYQCTYVCGCGNTEGGGTCCYLPVVSVTPTGKPPCTCESVEVEGNVSPGQKIKLTTFAKSLDPANTKVYQMIYHVERSGEKKELAQSQPIEAVEIAGSNGRYYTTWEYTIPTDGVGIISYHIWVEIICAYKKTMNNKTMLVSVLGIEAEKNTNIFGSVIDFLNSLLGRNNNKDQTSNLDGNNKPLPSPNNKGPYTVIGPCKDKSLKLCTFYPGANIRKGCYEVFFDIPVVSY